MHLMLRIVLGLVVVIVLVGLGAYVDGARMPVDHTTSVTGTVAAAPEKVFALITNVAAAPAWRPAVKSVKLLPADAGRDHWVEDLGHGETMSFLATGTEPVNAEGRGRREVRLEDPKASYGGTWVYEFSPAGGNVGAPATLLKITETGFIHPPIYRFMMTRVFGMTRNLDQYLANIQAAAAKP